MTHADEFETVDAPEGSAGGADGPALVVTVHQCSPNKTVFTEDGNSDGWIATDTTVEPGR